MRRLWQAIVRYVHANISTEQCRAEWEPVSSTRGPVVRHIGCGDLVQEDAKDEHVRQHHAKRCAVVIRLYNDGSAQIEAEDGYLMSEAQTRALKEFQYDQMKLAVETMEAALKRVNNTPRRVIPFRPEIH